MNAADFNQFYVGPDEYKMGLNIAELHKYIRNVDKDGTLTIKVDSFDLQTIMFEVKSSLSAKTSICALKMLNPETKTIKIEAEFTISVRISTSEFHKTCKDLLQFSPYMEIICGPDKLTLNCKGDSSTQGREFKNGGTENDVVITCIGGSHDMIRLICEIKHINYMYKCVNLCKDMEIRMRPNGVIFFVYQIGLASELLVGVAPRSTRDKVVNPNYEPNYEDTYTDEDDIALPFGGLKLKDETRDDVPPSSSSK
jgi:hypothetical protein